MRIGLDPYSSLLDLIPLALTIQNQGLPPSPAPASERKDIDGCQLIQDVELNSVRFRVRLDS